MDETSFAQALLFARNRGVLLPEQYYALDLQTRRYASTVSYLAGLDQIQTVLNAAYDVFESGGTFQTFKDKVAKEGIQLSTAHLDNIFRTNIQNAYAHGRWNHQQSNKSKRPYLRYSAIEDARVRPSHLKLNGVIRHIDDPFWLSFYPPNGFRCRCSIRALTEKQAQRYGITPDDLLPDTSIIDKGWNFHPANYSEHPQQILSTRLQRETAADPNQDQTIAYLNAVQLDLALETQADETIARALPKIEAQVFAEALEKTVKAQADDIRPSDLAMTLGLADLNRSLVELAQANVDSDNGIGKRIWGKIQSAFNRVFRFAKNTSKKLTGNNIANIDQLNLTAGAIIGIKTPTLFKQAQSEGKPITILNAKGIAIDLSKISGLDGALLAPNLNLKVISNDENGLVLQRTDEDATRYFVANSHAFSL